jgi:hypothetical protein
MREVGLAFRNLPRPALEGRRPGRDLYLFAHSCRGGDSYGEKADPADNNEPAAGPALHPASASRLGWLGSQTQVFQQFAVPAITNLDARHK